MQAGNGPWNEGSVSLVVLGIPFIALLHRIVESGRRVRSQIPPYASIPENSVPTEKRSTFSKYLASFSESLNVSSPAKERGSAYWRMSGSCFQIFDGAHQRRIILGIDDGDVLVLHRFIVVCVPDQDFQNGCVDARFLLLSDEFLHVCLGEIGVVLNEFTGSVVLDQRAVRFNLRVGDDEILHGDVRFDTLFVNAFAVWGEIPAGGELDVSVAIGEYGLEYPFAEGFVPINVARLLSCSAAAKISDEEAEPPLTSRTIGMSEDTCWFPDAVYRCLVLVPFLPSIVTITLPCGRNALAHFIAVSTSPPPLFLSSMIKDFRPLP